MGCVDQKETDENKENDKKCTPLQNSIDSDVKVSCNKGVCMFKCEDGTASVASATCFNGKWNINSKVEIKCEGKTTTTKKATTTTTAPPTTTTEEVCGKKCQKKKKKEQQKEDKKKDKENKKDKDKSKDKDKGKKDKGKKKNKELGDYDTIYDDIDDATTTTDVPTAAPTTTGVFTTAQETKPPKKKKKGKNLENAEEIGDLDSVDTNAGYSPYAFASGQGSDPSRCNPSDLSSQYGNGLSIDCDFGFKGWYICKITCANGRPDTEVVSCDTGSKQWDTSNVKCN